MAFSLKDYVAGRGVSPTLTDLQTLLSSLPPGSAQYRQLLDGLTQHVSYQSAAQQAQGVAPNVFPRVSRMQSHAQAASPRESCVARIQSPLHRKTSNALDKLVEALPHRVLANIECMEFFAGRMAYVITYKGGHEEEFGDNIDAFPSEADVARVILVCP